MEAISSEDRLLLAVPKKGRLYERVIGILGGAGLHHVRQHRLDIAQCSKQPVTIVFLPAADIAKYVSMGNIDMGITGEDIIAESEADVDVLMPLGMGKCRLAVQAPVGSVKGVEDLVGKKIVTSFPTLTKKYFESINPDVKTEIRYVTGSVEVAPSLGLADAVVDLVETGTTMHAAGLEAIGDVMTTETVLIANRHSAHPKLIEKIHSRIKGYVTALAHCMITYNCPRAQIKAASKITPGHDSPTITPLENDEMVSITSLVRTKDVSDIMDELKEIGAVSIVVIDVHNCRF